MRKPKLELKLTDRIENMIEKAQRDKRKNLISYILTELESKGLDLDTMITSFKYEKVQFHSIDILTLRINDKIVMQEFPSGSMSYGLSDRKYKLFLEDFFE